LPIMTGKPVSRGGKALPRDRGLLSRACPLPTALAPQASLEHVDVRMWAADGQVPGQVDAPRILAYCKWGCISATLSSRRHRDPTRAREETGERG